MAVALYFIDKLALRAGHEKDEDEADTVGCCTLKVLEEKNPGNALRTWVDREHPLSCQGAGTVGGDAQSRAHDWAGKLQMPELVPAGTGLLPQ
jgi:hypothetical protein